MKENLKVTKYQNSDLIGTTTSFTSDLSGETAPKYQWPAGGADSSGFTALPAGGREPYGLIGRDGVFWTSTAFFGTYGYRVRTYSYNSEAGLGGSNPEYGYSVRCIENDASVGMQNNIDKAHFGLYPNPGGNIFTVISSSNVNSIAIYNVVGTKVFTSKLDQKTSNEIDLSNFPKGLYFVKYFNSELIYINKIVVK